MYAVDLHNHTRFFHGFDRFAAVYDPIGYRLHALAARLRGLDGLALTNHDYFRPFVGEGVTAIPGIEVSTTDGHVLVVGPNPPTETEPESLTPGETVDLARERGCATVLAHPFRDSSARHSDAAFDAVEINGKHPHTWDRVQRLAERRDLPVVGGSDAHYPVEVGRVYTRIDVEELSPERVVDAIRDGRVEWAVTEDPISDTIRRGYRRIHDRKGHWDDWPPVETPPQSEDRSGANPGNGRESTADGGESSR